MPKFGLVFINSAPITRDRIHSTIHTSFGPSIDQFQPLEYQEMASFSEAPGGDAAKGAKIFKTKCAQCHVAEKGGGHKQVSYIFIIKL
jgi:cytochrome c5